MESLRCPPLVSANWLKSEMMIKQDYKSNIRILDATWDLPMFKRNFVQEHNDKRIPGAKYFSLDECRDKTSGLPNMLAKPEDFAKYVQDLAGIENDHHIVLYDNSERFGLFSAPRAWFVFKVMGHEKVSILDGGLPNWVKEGYETVSGGYKDEENYPPASTKYVPKYRPELVKEMAFMKANSQSASPVQVMDGRPNGRFRGIAPEPNPAIPSGHFANASNLPFFELFNMEKKVMKQPDEILEVFKSFKIDLDKDVISSCGTGIAASTLAFGAFFSKGKEVPLYDGSWTEWATKMPELIISEKES
eukprot:gene14041-15500_t